MKKLCLVVAIAMGLPVALQAAFQAGAIAGPTDGRGPTFAVQGSGGLLNGAAKEHVYDYETWDGRRRQLSRLDWDLKDVAMGGANGSLRLWDKLTFNGGLWLALTEGDGEMDDYDWLDPRSPDWTHYSLSEVDVTEGYILDLNAAWDVVGDWNGLTARALAGYKQDGWTWEDRGVYLLYPEYNYVPQDLNGANLINYEQEFRMPYLGASADWAWQNFTLAARLTYSPYMWATDWDDHIDRDMHYQEDFAGGDMLGLGIEARYDFTRGTLKGLFLAAALDYQKIDLIVGDMEYTDGATGERGGGEDMAGIENEYWILSLGGGVRF